VDVGSIVNILEVHVAFVFRVKVSRVYFDPEDGGGRYL
jgi:hypothetical protein